LYSFFRLLNFQFPRDLSQAELLFDFDKPGETGFVRSVPKPDFSGEGAGLAVLLEEKSLEIPGNAQADEAFDPPTDPDPSSQPDPIGIDKKQTVAVPPLMILADEDVPVREVALMQTMLVDSPHFIRQIQEKPSQPFLGQGREEMPDLLHVIHRF